MILSLRWICDHLHDISWDTVNVNFLVTEFNAKVAEIEQVEAVKIAVDDYAAARITGRGSQTMTLYVAEWDHTLSMPVRTDVPENVHQDAALLVRKEGDGVAFVTLRELGVEKDGLLAPLCIPDEQMMGDWRGAWETKDTLLDVDNKSITHRPDMWGHRGFAREIAALLQTTLVDESQFVADLEREYFDGKTDAGASVTLINEAPERCSTITALPLPAVNHVPSDVRMASRFVKVGYRPINALVDLTNYAMADWGHPMHAYDADHVANNTLRARMATPGETLVLLDDSELVLDQEDVVVDDGEKILGLAGIMGGKDDSIGDATSRVIIEAACWHASSTRRSAARHKLRTESSQRFEKTLDPATAPYALARFVHLACELGVMSVAPECAIAIVGPKQAPVVIDLCHGYLCNRLGFGVSPKRVVEILQSICFEVEVCTVDMESVYQVTIPSYRATKDVTGPHDLVEEIVRFYGFDNIEPSLPSLPKRATSTHDVMIVRNIKEYLAFGAHMSEQRNYAFYNEQVLAKLGWKAGQEIALRNPVSQEARRLVANLLPHLCANVMENMADHERCSFFEWNRVWQTSADAERSQLAGVWYDKRGGLDFYTLKQTVAQVCRLVGITPSWEKVMQEASQPWLDAYRGARVVHDGVTLGYFGQVDPLMVQRMGGLPESEMYAFVLDGTTLQKYKKAPFKVGTMSKYQHSSFDVSVLVPLACSVAELEGAITAVHELVVNVRLIDFFEKKEWTDRRSVALRITVAHDERTVSREELEQVRTQVIAALQERGGQLRA